MNTVSSLLKNLRNRTPVGTIEMFAGSTAPTDWLVCDGSAVSRTTYSSLFAVIGTTYGAGNGSTTFNLPNFKGRTAVGAGNGDATGHTNHALASKGGNENAIVPYHNHTASGGSVTNNSGIVIGTSGAHSHPSAIRVHHSSGSGSAYVLEVTQTAQKWSYNPVPTEGTNGTHTHTVPAHGHGFTNPSISYAGSSGNVTGANMMPYLTVNYIIYAGKTA